MWHPIHRLHNFHELYPYYLLRFRIICSVCLVDTAHRYYKIDKLFFIYICCYPFLVFCKHTIEVDKFQRYHCYHNPDIPLPSQSRWVGLLRCTEFIPHLYFCLQDITQHIMDKQIIHHHPHQEVLCNSHQLMPHPTLLKKRFVAPLDFHFYVFLTN